MDDAQIRARALHAALEALFRTHPVSQMNGRYKSHAKASERHRRAYLLNCAICGAYGHFAYMAGTTSVPQAEVLALLALIEQ